MEIPDTVQNSCKIDLTKAVPFQVFTGPHFVENLLSVPMWPVAMGWQMLP